MFLDSATGIPLKIISQLYGYDESYWRKMNAREAETRFSMSTERYQSIPKNRPSISLIEAINESGYSDLFRAEEIVALYVVSRMWTKTQVIWSFNCYGIPFDPHQRAGHLPRYMRDYFRQTINAETGQFIMRTNSHGPRLDSADSLYRPHDSAEWDSAFKRMSKMYPAKKKE